MRWRRGCSPRQPSLRATCPSSSVSAETTPRHAAGDESATHAATRAPPAPVRPVEAVAHTRDPLRPQHVPDGDTAADRVVPVHEPQHPSRVRHDVATPVSARVPAALQHHEGLHRHVVPGAPVDAGEAPRDPARCGRRRGRVRLLPGRVHREHLAHLQSRRAPARRVRLVRRSPRRRRERPVRNRRSCGPLPPARSRKSRPTSPRWARSRSANSARVGSPTRCPNTRNRSCCARSTSTGR